MEPVEKGKVQPDPRAELMVEEAWAVAIETEKFQVAFKEAMAARARAEDAAAAGETGEAFLAEREAANLARDAALKELDRASAAINAIEAAARQRRRHDAHG